MKKFLKWTAFIVIAIAVIVVAGISYITLALPNVGKPQAIKVELTPKRIARGKYLANNVTACVDCHSTRQWDKFAGPIDSNNLGSGGEKFDHNVDFPGTVYSPNITPLNLKSWSDGELFRAITTGVKKDGSAIFPIMPWPYYSKMDREDVYSIIAYLRTLKSTGQNYPGHKLDFPLNIIVHTMPEKSTLGTIPEEKDTLKYGEYLTNIAACKECHSQVNQGKIIAGLEYAGGREFKIAGNGTVRSANITTDTQTGIGNWTKEQFVAAFKQYTDTTKKPRSVGRGEFQSIMPWYKYGGMKVTDLQAIYVYLKKIKPIKNKIEKFTPVTTFD